MVVCSTKSANRACPDSRQSWFKHNPHVDGSELHAEHFTHGLVSLTDNWINPLQTRSRMWFPQFRGEQQHPLCGRLSELTQSVACRAGRFSCLHGVNHVQRVCSAWSVMNSTSMFSSMSRNNHWIRGRKHHLTFSKNLTIDHTIGQNVNFCKVTADWMDGWWMDGWLGGWWIDGWIAIIVSLCVCTIIKY